MFEVDVSPTYTAPVEFSMPGADGKAVACMFTGVFKRYLVDDAEALAKQAAAEKWSERRLAAELLVGWGAEVTRHGVLLPFTSEHRDAVLNIPGAARAVLDASRRAQRDAAEGN